jgi:hypothetical protein
MFPLEELLVEVLRSALEFGQGTVAPYIEREEVDLPVPGVDN